MVDIARRGVMLVIASPSGAGKSSIIARGDGDRPQPRALGLGDDRAASAPSEVEGVHYHFVVGRRVRAHARRRRAARMGRGARQPLRARRARGSSRSSPRATTSSSTSTTRARCSSTRRAARTWSRSSSCRPRSRSCAPASSAAPRTARTSSCERLKNARIEMEHWSEYDHVIINEDLETSVATVRAILAGARRHAGGAIPRWQASSKTCRTRSTRSRSRASREALRDREERRDRQVLGALVALEARRRQAAARPARRAT